MFRAELKVEAVCSPEALQLPMRLRSYSPDYQSQLQPVYFSFWTCDEKSSRVVSAAGSCSGTALEMRSGGASFESEL
jgi:hypothetical protein